jgi:hypothetical protein
VWRRPFFYEDPSTPFPVPTLLGSSEVSLFFEKCNSTPSCAQTILWRSEVSLFFEKCNSTPSCAQTILWHSEVSLFLSTICFYSSFLCTDDTVGQWSVSVFLSNVTLLLPVHRRYCGVVKCLCFFEQCNSTPSCAQTILWPSEVSLFFWAM